jgi:signal transduction histidine kinase
MNMTDITRTKELEHLVWIDDKMTSLGRVAAGISDELRNPLSGINIYLTTLKKICDSPESLELENLKKVEKILGKLQSASNKIESVIKRVMDFSKPTVPRLTLTSINRPIEEAINLCQVTCQKSGVKIEKSLCDDLPPCYSDPPSIEQVLLNLITNAVQAMKNQEGEKIIEITSAMESNRVVIRVADSGPGIPLMLRKKIFDPFFTTKKDSSGMGLSLCHRIIVDHGGSLDVFASKWGGSEFRIKIPVEKKTAQQ